MAHEALKERQGVMWGNAPFVSIADTLLDLHAGVADALEAKPGDLANRPALRTDQ